VNLAERWLSLLTDAIQRTQMTRRVRCLANRTWPGEPLPGRRRGCAPGAHFFHHQVGARIWSATTSRAQVVAVRSSLA